MFRSVLIPFLAFSVISTALLSTPAHAGRGEHIEQAIFSLYSSGAFKARHGNWFGAAIDYERAYRLNQTSPEILVRLAEAYYRTGRPQEAEKFANRALDEDSSAYDAYIILAELAMGRGDLAAADGYLLKRLEGKPDDLESRLRLGLIRENLNDMEGVVRAFTGYPGRRPGAAAANFHRGVALVRLKRISEARDAFRAALRENPGYIEAAENVAILSEDLDEDSAAIEAWELVMKMNPERDDALRKKIALLVEYDRLYEAQDDLERLLDITSDKSGAIRKLLAQIAVRNNDLATAARAMVPLAEKAGTETGYLELALVAAQAKTETEILVASLENAYHIGERSAIGLTLVKTYLILGEDSEAAEISQVMIDRSPGDTSTIWNIAILHHATKRETHAIELLLKLIEIEPTNASALNYVGYSWAEMGIELDRAEDFVRRALRKEPDNPQYLDSLGWIYFKRRQFEEARLQLERASSLMDTEPTILEHLGDVCMELGRRQEALGYYRSSLATGQSENEVALKEKILRLGE
ncbi:MAG: tetratricopeptide repeat protein [Candidatus Hydrogenedentota bacterium]